jgi:excisionase family DNA binding protein
MPEKRLEALLTIPEVAQELATSEAHVAALVRAGELPAQTTGRGQRRIERSQLEGFIARAYEEAERELRERGRVTVEPEVDTSDLPPGVRAVLDDFL